MLTYLRNHINKNQNTWFRNTSHPSICLLMMFLSGYWIIQDYAVFLGIILVLLGLLWIILSFSTISVETISKQSRVLNSTLMVLGCSIVLLGIVASIQIFSKPYWISIFSMVLFSIAFLACMKIFINECPIRISRTVKLGVTISSIAGLYSLGWYTYILINEVIFEKTIYPPGFQFIPLISVSGIAIITWSMLIMRIDQKKRPFALGTMYAIFGVCFTGMGLIVIIFI